MTVDERERAVRVAREDFLSGERPDGRLRPEIASSWRRSRFSGVAADADSVPYEPLLGPNRLLTAAATPVLDWLADQLTGGTAVILADADARILDRRAEGQTLSRHLDRVLCAPGFNFGEEHIGTNGIGSVLESPGPVMIAGAEHYRDNLQGFTCVGTPLRHPVHRRLVGVLDVCCRYDDTNGLMTPLLLSASREIESRMYAESSLRERMLLEEFLKVSRRTSAAVVTLNQDFIITNTAAASLLDPADHALLWDWASGSITRRGEFAGEVRLSRDVVLHGRARTVGEVRGGPAGVLVELRRPANGSPHRRPAEPRPREGGLLPGRSAAWGRALAELAAADRSGLDVLVTGEAGVGKLRATERIGGPDRTVLDAALAIVDPGWPDQLRRRLGLPGTLVLRHLDRTPEPLAATVAALLDGPRAARVVATADGSADCRLLDHFPARVELPPLRHRPEDIADVAPVLLAEGDGPAPRLQAQALQALMALEWRGNVRELAAILGAARLRAMGGDITLAHLPAEHRRAVTGRSLPTLKRTEREAILEALTDAHGNKLAAAERLGIARSTLYRKMRALGIDDKRWA
ncbi:helix-turn-helix domain-containing protein [Pseudonocardia yuanmonensis]|uniref:Helix-turn-helix domain-containing protein n=1 Tax=Pseudonocardia yuanmonensis TaxID=1095914 RepID=A0ABP8XUA1_9PSEU